MGQDSSDFRLEECYNLPMPRPQRFLFIWWSTPRASEVLKASRWSQCAARVGELLVKANANHKKKRSFNTNIRSLDVIISHQTLEDSFFFSTRVLWTATKRHFLLHLERDGADKLTLIEQKCGPVKQFSIPRYNSDLLQWGQEKGVCIVQQRSKLSHSGKLGLHITVECFCWRIEFASPCPKWG